MPKHHDQSVAEHSFFVGLYALHIADILEMDAIARFDILHAGLLHDAEEVWSGDTPSPYSKFMDIPLYVKKRLQKMLAPFNYDVYIAHYSDIIKLADLIEAYHWIKEEENMGNKNLKLMRIEIWTKINNAIKNLNCTVEQEALICDLARANVKVEPPYAKHMVAEG